MKVIFRAVPLFTLGLLVGVGCSTTTTVEDAGSTASSGTTSGGSSSGGTSSGGATSGGSTSGGATGTSSGSSTSGGTSTGGGPDLSCNGVGLPTTAPAMITLAGTVSKEDQSGSAPVEGATIDIFQSAGGTSFGTATSNAAGAFSMTVPTGGAPLDAYFHVTAAGYADTYWYPPAPFFFDVPNVPITVLTASTLGLLGYFAGATQQPGMGQTLLEVLDCGGVAISGAVVTSNPTAGKTAYLAGMLPSASATATDSSGTAFLFNVTAGPVSIGATLGSTTLRAHSVDVRPDVVTETSVAP